MGRGRRVWRTPPKRVKAHPRRGVGGSLTRLTRVEVVVGGGGGGGGGGGDGGYYGVVSTDLV